MHSKLLRKLAGIALVLPVALLGAQVDSLKNAPTNCSAEPHCYETPVHLDNPINTPGFEGKPSLSADGLEPARSPRR